MQGDLTTITATLLIRDEGALSNGYVVTMTGDPQPVATFFPCVQLLSEAWRDDFRTLCKHIVEDQFQSQGLRVNWVEPRTLAHD
jgi:hypothetical protein